MSHPWITSLCQEAVDEKTSIETSFLAAITSSNQPEIENLEEELKAAITESNAVMRKAYEEYVLEVREEIKTLPKGSKKWWRLTSILFGRAKKKTS